MQRRAEAILLILVTAIVAMLVYDRASVGAGPCRLPAGGACTIEDGQILVGVANGGAAEYVTRNGTAPFPAAGLVPDGTRCTKSAPNEQINNSVRRASITCTKDNLAEIDWGAEWPDGWTGDSPVAEIVALHVGALPGGEAVKICCKCMCRGDGDLMDGTWGSEVCTTITFDGSQYDKETVFTSGMTCAWAPGDSECSPGDGVYGRCRIANEAATTATMANVRFWDINAEYPTEGTD